MSGLLQSLWTTRSDWFHIRTFFQKKVGVILDFLELFQNFFDVFRETCCCFVIMWSMSKAFDFLWLAQFILALFLEQSCVGFVSLSKKISFEVSTCELTVLCIFRCRSVANRLFNDKNYSKFQPFSRRFCGKENSMQANTIVIRLPTSPLNKTTTFENKNKFCSRTKKCATNRKKSTMTFQKVVLSFKRCSILMQMCVAKPVNHKNLMLSMLKNSNFTQHPLLIFGFCLQWTHISWT